MQWKKDLELLIAQTKALVAPPVETSRPESVGSAPRPVERMEIAEAPTAPLRLTPSFAPMKWRATSRDEIKARVASFKAHQQKFEREREEYCLQTLARTRATLEKRLPD